MVVVTDSQISEFIKEQKILPKNFNPVLKPKNWQNQFEQIVQSKSGRTFKLIVRQSQVNPLDFSVIFGVMINGKLFRLRRYNGDSHEHTNKIERNKMDGFHIHKATERYQSIGFREDAYSEKTTKYSDWRTALNAMISDNNFIMEVAKNQTRLL
ncbi:hypothetical protein COT48_03275 [Candidatus Woesearchaeota archaeon CG08_land_8_20_14_0_20_47_9]|nr:MAG: hypothetical protein COV22_00785 [Candidatus Woesearchaeota archaeon CG10_big_fil_rev_8_21_14_0_10_47_5]PIO03892.1 MAG: hypothetical protein COT48_03275 [Candidatus Woesearchaeota archaeon CG08_land_8_20_14_0_20_47_9]HII30337.1 hypothetical protein [Candidatus Woesearchaeota archaeon]